MPPAPPAPLDAETQRDPVEIAAELYARLCREGQAPPISEFVGRFPDQAEELRLLLPAVAFLERGKSSLSSASSARTGPPASPGALAPAAGTLPFERLGDNRLVRELGRGGMGIVYEAVQEPLDRVVAVKILPLHAAPDSPSRQRFLREARVVARLDHPHIVPIHAIGEQDGIPFYVMARIEGAGLDRIESFTPSLPAVGTPARARWVAEVGLQAAQALAYAHDQGVLHRDVKPGNLLRDRAGKVWLTDFGLAKLVDDLSLTATGDLPGTLRYLAPECLNAEADARSDVYGLGLTLYELAIGRAAFPETHRGRLLHQIQKHEVAPPRQLEPGLPRDLETIILRAMAADPAGRYPSARALSADLERFLDGRPIAARRPTWIEQARVQIRRNPAVAALGATTALLALVIAALIWFRPLPPPPQDRPPGESPATTPGTAADRPGPRIPEEPRPRPGLDRGGPGRGFGPPFPPGDPGRGRFGLARPRDRRDSDLEAVPPPPPPVPAPPGAPRSRMPLGPPPGRRRGQEEPLPPSAPREKRDNPRASVDSRRAPAFSSLER